MKILVVGRSFAPGRGSEPGFTWNWARHWSREHQVWVIAHPEFRDDVEEELRRTPQPNLHIVWMDLPRWLCPWRVSGRGAGVGVHYVMWLQAAYRRARALHAEIGFDFAHHMSLGTVSVPSPLWRLGIPFLWGPIGGGQTTPAAFLRCFGRDRFREALRSWRVRLLHLSPTLRKAARRSLVLATNPETLEVLRRAGATAVYPLLDGALPGEFIPEAPIARPTRDGITLLWAGAFESRKALPLAFEALLRTDPGIRLQVAGAGPKEAEWRELASSMGLENRVEFLGLLSWPELRRHFGEADGFLFTSIRDSSGTVVLEAMAYALPIVVLNHQGVGTYVPDSAALKVPVTNPTETVAALATAIGRLASSPFMRDEMGRAAWEFARLQVWDQKTVMVEQLVDDYMNQYLKTGTTAARARSTLIAG